MRTRDPLGQRLAEQPQHSRPSAAAASGHESQKPTGRPRRGRPSKPRKSSPPKSEVIASEADDTDDKMVATRSGRKTVSPPSSPDPTSPPSSAMTKKSSSRKSAASAGAAGKTWTHAPSTLTLLWLAVSLPLVAWDTVYVLGRPATMEGGWLHWPFWAPYALYGEVDHVYGWKAWEARNGFTAAQGSLNVVETVMYLAYAWMYYSRSSTGSGAPELVTVAEAATGGKEATRKVLVGRDAGVALLLAFSAAVMTLSKTVLYWLNEYFSHFDNIGHNTAIDLIFLWIIPNGAWIALPTYMVYVMGSEIIEGLTIASQGVPIKSE